MGAQTREDAPGGVLPLLDISRAGSRTELAFAELLHAIQTNGAAYSRHFGRDFWSDLDADPRLRRSFDEQMNWRLQRQAPQIAVGHDWGRFPRVLDVGGGDGTVLEVILTAHPELQGEGLDLAPTAQAATARFTAAGLGGRAGAVAGSFFDPLPSGFDAYLVCDIVHDWDDDPSVLPEGGRDLLDGGADRTDPRAGHRTALCDSGGHDQRSTPVPLHRSGLR